MLKPAICYKDQLDELFAKEVYSDRYFYYTGYQYAFELPNIRLQDNLYQWAILDNDRVVGYLSYWVDPIIDCINRFGLYSFDEGNLTVPRDTFTKMEELISQHHKLEWRVISGNHAKRGYDNFCRKHGGNVVCLHDIAKDSQGNYVDEYIYEIIN